MPIYGEDLLLGSSVDKIHPGNPWVYTCRCMCRSGVDGYDPRSVHPGRVRVRGSRCPGVSVGVYATDVFPAKSNSSSASLSSLSGKRIPR